jgi:hypothetical protein
MPGSRSDHTNRDPSERRARHLRYALAVAIVVTFSFGVFSAAGWEAADVLGPTYESEPTFNVRCEFGNCTFYAGIDPRTARNTSHHWDWGDGTKGEGRLVDHFFVGDDRSYTVKLTSTNDYTGDVVRSRITCTREDYTLVVSCG